MFLCAYKLKNKFQLGEEGIRNIFCGILNHATVQYSTKFPSLMTNVLLQLVRDIINGECYQQALTSLGHQEGQRVFREDPKIFELCPIVLNNVQHIFPGGENFSSGGFAPLRPPGYDPGYQRYEKRLEQQKSLPNVYVFVAEENLKEGL